MNDINDFDSAEEITIAANMHDFGAEDAPRVSKSTFHGEEADDEEKRNLDTILGIPVDVQVVLGSASMLVANLLKLGRGSARSFRSTTGSANRSTSSSTAAW